MSAATAIRRLLLVAALALVAVPASASAQANGLSFDPLGEVPPILRSKVPGHVEARSSSAPFLPLLVLKASHGYRVGVIGFGSTVLLEVIHGRARAITAYAARGVVRPGRLEASFGDLGRIAMHFQRSSNQPRANPHRDCKRGDLIVRRRGVYVGSFRFRGEGGYISVRAHRARGRVSTIAPWCLRSQVDGPDQHAVRPAQHGDPLELAAVGASWREGISSTSVGAVALGGRTLFFASTAQSEGDLAILRFAFTSAGSAQAFSVDNALTHAQIKPPAPFHGTGIYRAGPDGTKTWSGGLAVNFPGAPRLPLTGPQFKPELEAGF
jgi:hypothetical protein